MNWVHFPLHADTPEKGLSLQELFAGRDVDVQAMYTRMKSLMDREGLPYSQRTHTYNSRLAQELGKWADTQPHGDAIHDALFRAYFVEGINISDIDRLVDIAQNIGLDKNAARQILVERTFSSMIDADWEKSRALEITGVPTFVASGFGLVGAQEYETLSQWLTQVIAKS